MSLIEQYRELPREIVDIICLFTGKFVFDKQGKLRSIVNLLDFENIKSHIAQYLNIAYHYNMNRERLVRILYTQKNGVMSNEKKIQEELLCSQFIDYNRHPLLFAKSSPLENVFVPLEKFTFCDTCKHKLSSVDLASPKSFIKHIMFNGFSYFIKMSTDQLKGICRQCLTPIFEITDVPVITTIIPRDQKAMISQKINSFCSKSYNKRVTRVRHGVGRR